MGAEEGPLFLSPFRRPGFVNLWVMKKGALLRGLLFLSVRIRFLSICGSGPKGKGIVSSPI